MLLLGSSRCVRWSLQSDIANEMFSVPSFCNPLNVDVRIEGAVYRHVEQVSPTTTKKKKGVCTAVECFIGRQGPPLTSSLHASSPPPPVFHFLSPLWSPPLFPCPVQCSQSGRLYKVLNISCYCFIVSYSFILPTVLFSSTAFSLTHPAAPGLQQSYPFLPTSPPPSIFCWCPSDCIFTKGKYSCAFEHL